MFQFHSDNDELPDDEESSVGQTSADCSSYCTRVDSYDLFQCRQCEFMHRFPSKVLRHFNYRHTKHCPYQCGYCDFRSVESGKVKRHCGSAHRGQPAKVIKVDVDAKTSEPVGVLMSGSNKDEDVETEDNDENDDRPDEDSQMWWRQHVQTADNQMVCCRLCGYRQVGMSALKRHILAIHLGFTPFACKYCDFSTMEIRKVREHIKKIHPGLAIKVIRRKYMSDTGRERAVGSPMHGVKVSHTSTDVGGTNITQSPLPSIRYRPRPAGIPASEACAFDNISTFTDMLITQSAENRTSTPAPLLLSTALNVKPEPLAIDPSLDVPQHHLTFYKCIYCDFCSEEHLHDIRDHIFVAHLRRNHFMCAHCHFGSMTRDDVIAHCSTDHPDKIQKVNEDKTHSRNISILETHGDVLLVGMMSNDNVPLIELPMNIQEGAATCNEFEAQATAAPGVGQQATNDTMPSRCVKPTARKSTSNSPSTNPKKRTEGLNARPMKKHKKGARVTYTCKSCGFSNIRMDAMEKHVVRIHMRQMRMGCPYCAVKYSCERYVRKHIIVVHPGEKVLHNNAIAQNRKVIRTFITTAPARRPGVSAPAPSAVVESQTQSKKKPGNTDRFNVSGVRQMSQLRTGDRAHSTITIGPAVEDAEDDGKLTQLRSSAVSEDSPTSGFLWKCTTCGTKLAMLEEMRCHVLIEHMDLQPYQCSVCDFGGRSNDLVAAHIRDTHQHSRIHIPVVDVTAEKCDCLKEKMARVRMKKKTPSPPAETVSNSNEKFDYSKLCTTSKHGETVYRCDLCDHEVRSKSTMMHHRRSHSRFQPFGCSYCAYKSSKRVFLESHIHSVHAGRPLKYHFIEKDGTDSHDEDENHTSAAESNSEKTVLNRGVQSTLNKTTPRTPTDPPTAAVTAEGRVKAACSSDIVVPSSEDNVDSDDCQRQMFACVMCGKTMLLRTSVRHHIMLDHLNYRPFKCNYCKYTGTHRRGVRAHIMKCHARKECIIVLRSKKNLETIVETNITQATDLNDASKPPKSNKDNVNKSKKSNKDNVNKSQKSNKDNVNKSPEDNWDHLNKSPEGNKDNVNKDPTNKSTESQDVPTESYLCVLCKTFTASWKHGMLRHIAREINYSPFLCPHCSFSTSRQDTVRTHIKSAHPNLEVYVKFNKDDAKEQRALELLEMSVVPHDANMVGSNAEETSGESSEFLQLNNERSPFLLSCVVCVSIGLYPYIHSCLRVK